MESESKELVLSSTDSEEQVQQHPEYLYEEQQYAQQEENQEEELTSMSSFQPDRQVNLEKDENKEQSEQIINSALLDTDSQNNQKLAQQFKQVKFHVKDCEETIKKIESILNVNREQFMHGKTSISPGKTGVYLSFFVKPQYYELIWPLQELLANKEQIQSVQPDSPIVPKAKKNKNKSVKPITFLIDNVGQFILQIEQFLGVQRSVFTQGQPNIQKHKGKYILQLMTSQQYYDKICKQFSNFIYNGQNKIVNIDKIKQEKYKKISTSIMNGQTKFQVQFHVWNCEGVLKSIESILKIPREKFINENLTIVPKKPGFNLQFNVIPEYIDQVKPLQEQLSLKLEQIVVKVDNAQEAMKKLETHLNLKQDQFCSQVTIKQSKDGYDQLAVIIVSIFKQKAQMFLKSCTSENIAVKSKCSQISKSEVKSDCLQTLSFHVLDCEEALKIMESTLNTKRENFMEGQQISITQTQFGYQLQFVANQNYIKLLLPLQESLSLKFEKVVAITDNCDETMCKLEAHLNITRDKFCSNSSITKLNENLDKLTLMVLSKYVTQSLILFSNLSRQTTQVIKQAQQCIENKNNVQPTQQNAIPRASIQFHVLNCEKTLNSIEQSLKNSRQTFLFGKPSFGIKKPGFSLSIFVKPEYVDQVKLLSEQLSLKLEQIVVKVDNAQEAMKKLETHLNLKQDQFCSKVNIVSRKKKPQELTIQLISEYKIQVEQFLNSISIKEPTQQAKECKNINQQSQSAILTSQSNIAEENKSNTKIQNNNINQQPKPIDNEEVLNSSSSESFDIEISDSNEQTTQQNVQVKYEQQKQDQNEDSDSEIEFNISDSELSENDQKKEKRIPVQNEQLVELPPHQTIIVPDIEQFITELETVLVVERNRILTVVQDTVLANGMHQIKIQINAENKKNVEQAIAMINRK
ncbi:Hypothetical_protein [Hexamita inflata]|uniref:Hypothetical_protein n=1 Tax=Hexamita inflata TaxID=28002 RepID=A0AA86NDR3_9EUKA|nr:Hypothetical protein HINF_LOCUS4849 [Hexamita inflata]